MNIYPSLISADLLNLNSVIVDCSPYSDGFHIDVMDNHFVPNLTWGLSFIESFMKATLLPLHIHCMVNDPLNWASKIHLRTIDHFIFHYEALSSDLQIEAIYSQIKKKNAFLGIALNPSTLVDAIIPYVHFLDHILLMTVNPGFSGQLCIESVFEKIEFLSSLKQSQNKFFDITVDGGITLHHLAFLKTKKVDGAALASAIFSAEKPLEALKKISFIAKNNF